MGVTGNCRLHGAELICPSAGCGPASQRLDGHVPTQAAEVPAQVQDLAAPAPGEQVGQDQGEMAQPGGGCHAQMFPRWARSNNCAAPLTFLLRRVATSSACSCLSPRQPLGLH
jgi:hypothetical protein